MSVLDDFNKKILNPDLSQGDLVELHNMAKDLYKSYCSPNALDRIKFDEDIVTELRDGKIFLGYPSKTIYKSE